MESCPGRPVLPPGLRAVVTGGSGFIGRRLARRLAAGGARVVSVDRRDPPPPGRGGLREAGSGRPGSISFVRADCRRPPALRRAIQGAGVIFHLAAGNGHQASMEFPLADFEDGVAALLGLLEAAAEAAPEARIVFTSTRQLYGRLGRPGVTEAHPLAPPDVHSVHKEAGEHLLRRFAARRAAGFAVLRLTNTYGPGQPLRGPGAGFVGNFLRSALAGEAITVLGRGDLVRDLNHVEDVVDALIRAGSPGSPSGTWNLGAPPITLRAFAEAVFRTLGKPPRIREVPLPPDLAAIAVGDIHGDWSRASRDLGWEPRIPLETGLAETIRALSP